MQKFITYNNTYLFVAILSQIIRLKFTNKWCHKQQGLTNKKKNWEKDKWPSTGDTHTLTKNTGKICVRIYIYIILYNNVPI